MKRLLCLPFLLLASTLWAGTITWDAPTMNTDGSPLTDLAGYNFYLGTATGAYAIFIPNIPPTETQYDVTNLVVPGTTYYCVVTALNTAGIESAYSNELVFTVAAPLQSNPPANVGYTP